MIIGPNRKYELATNSQTVISVSRGEWDRNCAIHYINDYKLIVNSICNEPWASIIDLRDWQSGTKDVMEITAKLNEWSADNNQKIEIYICDSELKIRLMQSLEEYLGNIEIIYVGSKQEAFDILTAKGFMND